MISILPQSKGAVIGINADGKVTPDIYKNLLRPTFLKTIKQYGRLRLLFFADNFKGWSNPFSIIQDGWTMLRVRRHLQRVACVCKPGWKQKLTQLSNPFIKGKARWFDIKDEDAAWKWIFEGE